MFTIAELKHIVAGLTMSAKSASRLANREGQPESVAMEYRRVIGEVSEVHKKVQTMLDDAIRAEAVKAAKK